MMPMPFDDRDVLENYEVVMVHGHKTRRYFVGAFNPVQAMREARLRLTLDVRNHWGFQVDTCLPVRLGERR